VDHPSQLQGILSAQSLKTCRIKQKEIAKVDSLSNNTTISYKAKSKDREEDRKGESRAKSSFVN